MLNATLSRIVVDAGPIIGLLTPRDAYHVDAVRGFSQLERAGVTVVVPLAIVFEVFKWLLHRTDLGKARSGLTLMLDRVQIAYPSPDDLTEALDLMQARPGWNGTLEDAVVAQAALDLDVPVWTINYRDLNAFRSLHFWTPV
jgi:hypothetical protein